MVEELLSSGERSTIPGGQHKKDSLQEEGETYPLANPGLAEAPNIDHSTVVPCTGADRSATQSLIDTNHLYNQHQYEDEESRHIDETWHNGAGVKTEAETNTGDYLHGDTHQGNNRNEGVTNLGGDKTKDNSFHQVHLHGASQVNFQPHRGLNKMKRLFTGPTNSLGISHHEVTKVFERAKRKGVTMKQAKSKIRKTNLLTKVFSKTLTGKLAEDLAEIVAKTLTRKCTRDFAKELAKDLTKVFVKTLTRKLVKDLAKTRTLAERLAKSLTEVFNKTLTRKLAKDLAEMVQERD